LQPNTSYLFISNHRDILLDTTLLNTALFEHGLVMTASAIGDSQKSVFEHFGKTKPKLLVQRGLTPRDVAEF
jgi:hypothetical protein